ncbi:MAG: hypothetical protein BWZ01_02056 [Deltaproteobacteria bacterium ADurb.BinA179]|nr:MAG: hypothetical protein BWZ01_02056 [Deltaproteobacteria bacterium ADurb.BinA179]HNU75785.1 hypothetical protein [Deltaproteobacteria bacterium]HRR21219.1 hypothetical protein [Desulfomonilia bacterium]HOD71972.1 hypothetical protein [Deltaproteobacteria bacterium]HOE73307.1 hypothetical protein [Deltaproteobacteria bacterium]
MNDTFGNMINRIRGLPGYPALQTRVKHILCDTVLSVLGPAFEVVGRYVPEFRKEIEPWEEGRRFSIGVLPNGPAVTLEKTGGRIRYLGKGMRSPHISMAFKNYDSALLVLMSIMGSHQAFAENRILVYGDLAKTMEINRVVNIVNAYLLPGFVLKTVLKRPPKMGIKNYISKGKVYAGLLPAVVRHMI